MKKIKMCQKVLLTAFCIFSLLDASAQCTPNSATGTLGISPAPDNVTCIVRGVPYDITMQLENFTSIFSPSLGTINVNYARIDSITNLPCGLTWQSNKLTYASGETGCIRVSGTSTDAVGQYKLQVYLTFELNIPIVGIYTVSGELSYLQQQLQGVGSLFGSDVDYYSRVIETGTPCPAIDRDTNAINLLNCQHLSILTGAITGSPICAGGLVTVPFTVTSAFISGNVFTAQLSNASGSFVNPVNIGMLNGTTSGNILATIPSNTVTGSGYHIRVISSDPPVNGTNNSSNLTINKCLTLTAASATVLPGSQVVIPITVNGFQSIATAQGSIEFDPAVISFVQAEQFGLTGMSAASFGTSQVASGILTFSWDDVTTQGVTLADGSVIFALRFSAAGTAGQQSSVEFVNSPALLEFLNPQSVAVNALYLPSVVTIVSSVYVEGEIRSENGDPVPTVTINLTGQSPQTIVTGVDGSFSLNITQGGSYAVTPSKNNDITKSNGVTTGDILQVRRHILNIQSLGTPYKIIAADVNGSSTVSTQDILLIRSVILGNTSTFPNGKLWAFMPSNHVFANPLNPFPYPISLSYSDISQMSGQDFIGIKLGDVNNSWDPNTPKTGAIGNLQFAMDEYKSLPGGEITVPVKVKDFKSATGYQFTLSWNPEVLSLLEVNNKALNGYYGMNRINEGYLTTSWNDDMAKEITLNDGEAVFELKFKTIGAIGTQSAIKIGSELTASEAYNENLDLLNIVPSNGVVKVGEPSASVNQPSSIIHLQVQPNPFSNATNIIFSNPEDETVSIVIYDLLGKEIKHVKADYIAGEHKLEWVGDDNAGKPISKGLYHVRMVAGDKAMGMKVVLMR